MMVVNPSVESGGRVAAPEPEQIGPYLLLRTLGGGGTGMVYLGRDQTSGILAAVKVIKPRYAADPRFRARLQDQLAAAYRTPRFCTTPVLAADLEGDPPWVATEFVEAPDLGAALVERGRLDAAQQQILAAGLAAALRELHHRGVSHGDLKPSDILLTPLGPRLADIGIAHPEDAETYYPAPELANGEPPGPATDVFAWACAVTHAATGVPPFGEAREPNQRHSGEAREPNQRRSGEAREPNRNLSRTGNHGATAYRPDLRAVADPIRELVATALYRDPATRPSAAGLVHRLSQLAEPATTWVLDAAAAPPGTLPESPPPAELPPPPAPVPAPRRSSHRVALFAALAAGLAAVLVTVTALGWFLLRDDPDQATAAPQLVDPLPSDAPVAGVDECLIGTWTLSSVAREHYIDDVPVETTSDGGSVYHYRPDGSFTAEIDQTEVGTAEGQEYALVITGTIDGTYQAEDGILTWADTVPDGELVATADGEEVLRAPMTAILEEGEYECTDESLTVDYEVNGPHEFTRT